MEKTLEALSAVGGLRLEAEDQNVQASNLQPLTYYLTRT